MSKLFKLLALCALAAQGAAVPPALAEDEPQYLSDGQGVAAPGAARGQSVSQFEIDSQLSQIQSEIRSQRDLTDLRLNTLENEIQVSAAYTERLLFAFLIAGGLVTFVVLVTLNKQSNVNNERMRNLIREAESSLDDLHRLLDRPEAEHFHVSRKMHRIMNKMREKENPSLPQKDINDIFAASEDPTLPVTLHLQANALRNEQRGDWSSAIHLWEKLLSIDDTSPEVLLHLAQNYKRLAEVSSGDMAARMRDASLDYFQKYTTRTNMRTHSERELRKMASLGVTQGAVAEASAMRTPTGVASSIGQLPQTPPAEQPKEAPEDEPQPEKAITFKEYKQLKVKKPAKAKVTPKRRKSVAESLLSARKPTVSQVEVASISSASAPEPSDGAAKGNGSASELAKSGPGEEKGAGDSAATKGQDKPVLTAEQEAGPKAGAEPENKGGTVARKDDAAEKSPLAEVEKDTAKQVRAKAETKPKAAPSEEKKEAPGPKAEAAEAKKEALAPKAEAKGVKEAIVSGAGGNGSDATAKRPAADGGSPQAPAAIALARGSNGSAMDPQAAAKALKSRKDKAKEHFGRYASAKTKKDRIQWLEAAEEEYTAAARYSDDLDLYRLWGATILELATVDVGNAKRHVPRAIEVFVSSKAQSNGAFSNELSLCHAIMGDEASCRKVLEEAKGQGSLDTENFLTMPDFEKYRDKPWFRALSET